MNIRFLFKSIKTRLTLWFLLVSILPLIIFATIIYIQRADVIKLRSFEKLSAIRDLKVNKLKTWIKEREGDILISSQDYEIRRAAKAIKQNTQFAQDTESVTIARELMSRLIKNYQDYTELFILDTSGTIRISTIITSEGMDKSDDEYFLLPKETGTIHIKDIYISKVTNVPTMSFSIPIFSSDRSKEIIGVLVALVDLEHSLYDLLLSRVGLGETGETLIVNKDVYALNELRFFERAPLKLQITAEPAKQAALGNTGNTVTTDYIGKKVLAAYTFIPETQWGFVSKQDYAELNRPIREMFRNIIIIVFISMFLVYIAANILGQLIARPILSITETAKRISDGDLTVKNAIESKDEIGFLSQTINNMTNSISSQMTITEGTRIINEKLIAETELIPFSKALLEELMETTQSNMGTIYRLSENGKQIDPLFSLGVNTELLTPFDSEKFEGEFGISLSKKKISFLKNIPQDTKFKLKTFTGEISPREMITIPIIIKEKVIFLISLASIKKFTKETFEILSLTQLSLNSAFSNILSTEKLTELATDLQAKTEELESQAEELQTTSEEIQEQNIELDLQRTQVEEANRLKSEFLSNMSHELRTPLNSVLALSRVLSLKAKKKLSSEEKNYIDIIERNGRQLLDMINDILDLSKIESGQLDVSLNVFSIDTVIKTILEQVKPLAEEKNIKLFVKSLDNLPQIQSDKTKVYLIFQNLISNAVKFTSEGKISISVTYDKINTFIDVQDTGIGIPEKELPRIFEEFRQVDGSPTREFGGTGLGLAIAKKTVKILGGDITVQSSLGKGSTFSVVLPIQYKFPSNVEIIPETPPTTKVQDALDIPKSRSETKILIIENDPIARMQIKNLLESEGFFVDLAKNGQEAYDYLQHTIPDGIILDLMMPKIDGFEVLEKIRKDKSTKNIPVLILSAKSLTTGDRKKLKSNNIQHMIRKGDINRTELLDGIYTMLGFVSNDVLSTTAKPEEKSRERISKKQRKRGKSIVLVAEDNPDNMATLRAVLGNTYTIIEAIDGKKAVELIQKENPDLVLLDISLPKKDGYSVIAKIRELPQTKDIPVVAVTAHAMKGDREDILRAGCDDYIAKPFDPAQILEKIEKLLQHSSTTNKGQ